LRKHDRLKSRKRENNEEKANSICVLLHASGFYCRLYSPYMAPKVGRYIRRMVEYFAGDFFTNGAGVVVYPTPKNSKLRQLLEGSRKHDRIKARKRGKSELPIRKGLYGNGIWSDLHCVHFDTTHLFSRTLLFHSGFF
jgi:hypothetical protein